MQTQTTITDLFRPQQVTEAKEEEKRLERQLQQAKLNPVADISEVRRRLNVIKHQIETLVPKPYSGKDADYAVARVAQLREELLQGMPSHEEMRKCPAGAVPKHMEWEKRNKAKIAEYKQHVLRLNAGTDNDEIASLEHFRPSLSSLNMHNTVVAGKDFYLPPTNTQAVVFNEAQIAILRVLAPEVAERLSLLTNEQRGEVKDILQSSAKKQKKATPPKKKREYTPEQRAAAAARMKKMHEDRKANQPVSQEGAE